MPPGLFGSRTLGAALGSRTNALNGLRLVFAAAVIISHAWWLGGYGPEPALYGIKLGTAGVMGFFAISGYLITVSAERSDALAFAAARWTRIYPALAVAALAVAFIAAPIGALLTEGQWEVRGALAFVAAALTLVIGTTKTPPIGTSLAGNNDPSDWDGPLWTLTWEVLCYVLVAVAVYAARRASAGRTLHGRAPHRIVILFLFALFSGAVAGKVVGGGYGSGRTEFVLPFIAVFLAGALLATLRNRLRPGVFPAAAAGLAVWGALATGFGTALAPLPFAYLVLCAGSVRSHVGNRWDISYGIYIYGWPAQQLLAAALVPARLSPLAFAAIALVVVWPLGLLSCLAIERPAQRLRARILGAPRTGQGPPEPVATE
ncbi:acyltransferase [Sinomonas cyclohexanicum]|uniref:Acyltransferase n=1 Tax=Sinomonas cyclohexanicum TaxID=322009 RepID=A0ABN6FLF9_SINCY|nr:acyltransferase [Corynebacterium cyclohexanicum]BCT77484.1 acyltransferase [Corynebacterium cyclohexanicum]